MSELKPLPKVGDLVKVPYLYSDGYWVGEVEKIYSPDNQDGTEEKTVLIRLRDIKTGGWGVTTAKSLGCRNE